MWIVLCFGLTFGLLASSWASSTQDVKVRSCSHKGVFYIQGDTRHSLNFTEAQQLCERLEATLANAEQLADAYMTGLEICRYGWINDGNVTIPRQKGNPLCRNNQTGLIIFKSLDSQHDAFCYDDRDTSEKNCSQAIDLQSIADPVPPPPKKEEITKEPYSTEAPTEDPTKNHTGNDKDEPTETPTTATDTEIHNLTTLDPEDIESQTSQFSTEETSEPTTNTEELTTVGDVRLDGEAGPKSLTTTSRPGLEIAGSGMGDTHTEALTSTEPSHVTSQNLPEESIEENETTDSGVAGSDSKGRMMHPPEEDKSKSESSDWLIIVGVIVAVAAILLVCAAVATRKRWCGKSQTLMITKSGSEENGAAASASSSRAQEREQEMVTLMNKEKIQENGNTEEFTVITLEESSEKTQQA